ncbi:terminase small subunit-like protein [Tsuneonella sp. HG222]
MGRPSAFTQEIADSICERLADGESLRAICTDPDMPATSTVCRWLSLDKTFSEQYAHARELQADALFDDCLAIADKTTLKAAEDVNERKLQIDTRKWMAGKLKGKYSDKVKHVGGDDDDNPIAFKGWDITFGS